VSCVSGVRAAAIDAMPVRVGGVAVLVMVCATGVDWLVRL